MSQTQSLDCRRPYESGGLEQSGVCNRTVPIVVELRNSTGRASASTCESSDLGRGAVASSGGAGEHWHSVSQLGQPADSVDLQQVVCCVPQSQALAHSAAVSFWQQQYASSGLGMSIPQQMQTNTEFRNFTALI